MIIQKKSLADMVAERLRQQITEGVYAIGDKLPTNNKYDENRKIETQAIVVNFPLPSERRKLFVHRTVRRSLWKRTSCFMIRLRKHYKPDTDHVKYV